MITFPINDIAELFMAFFLMCIGLIVMAAAIEKWTETKYPTKRVAYALALVWGSSLTLITGYNIAMALA